MNEKFTFCILQIFLSISVKFILHNIYNRYISIYMCVFYTILFFIFLLWTRYNKYLQYI